ncbi:unnamed protein product (mitochondrion) [Plasmodiophora brassicae]|uniref:Uncharacterized protein n=1 Tax=Plasmodiophora brassicae TaxID=37360 RepID=A0A3P3YDF4_PLABS|nr:unnamed protein product [Plasmodiophora brassicae]
MQPSQATQGKLHGFRLMSTVPTSKAYARCFNQWIEDPEHQTCPMCRREILTRVRSYCRVKKPCRRMVPPELVALRHME